MIDGNSRIVDLSTYEDDKEQIISHHTDMQIDATYPEHLKLLPTEIWFKIYANLLFDTDWKDNRHFALSCRFFRNIDKDYKPTIGLALHGAEGNCNRNDKSK